MAVQKLSENVKFTIRKKLIFKENIMANYCKKCGKKLGLFYEEGLCKECQENEEIEKKRIELEEELLQIKSRIKNRISNLEKLHEINYNENNKHYEYRNIYLAVDSIVNERVLSEIFRIDEIKELGLSGWKVISIIPKTIGVGLENVSFGSSAGTTWGGGMGGNVCGVYVILEKEIKTKKSEKEIASYILEKEELELLYNET
jgi:hypothetical protein